MYHSNADAAAALGLTGRSFARVCRQLGIETPYARARRLRQGAKAEGSAPPR